MGLTCQTLVLLLFILVIILAFCVAWLSCAIKRSRHPTTGGADADGGDEMTSDDDDDSFEGGGKKRFDFAIQEPWFTKILEGEKTVEGRLNRGRFTEFKVGDTVQVRRSRPKDDTTEYPGPRRFNVEITKRTEYPSFEKMIKDEGLKVVLPGLKSADKGVEVYRAFYTTEDEASVGVVAFHFKVLGEAKK